MKRIFVCLILVICAFPTFSQEREREYRTLLEGKDIRISGMGGPMMLFTGAAGEFAHMMGGGGGIMVNNFFFGGYGLGLTNTIRDYADGTYSGDVISIGHGGFWIGYSFFGHLPVHVSVSSLAGFGEFGLRQLDSYFIDRKDQIFVLTPIVEIEANITRFLRIGAGVSYSLTSGVNFFENYSNRDFSAPGAYLGLKFGWF